MTIRFVLAMAGAVATSSIALYDAYHQAVLGSDSAFADSYGVTPTLLIGDAVHGLTYVALVWVLIGEALRIDDGRRFPRWTRRLLVGCFAALAAAFLLGVPVRLWSVPDGPPAAVLGTVAGIAFFAMFLLAFLLGIASLRTPGVRPSAVCLTLVLPAVLVAVLLGVLGNPWAHPGYAEALVNVGVALFAYHRIDRTRAAETDPSSATLTLTP